MQVLENYITGKWIAGEGSGQQLYNAVTGQPNFVAGTEGIDFEAALHYARRVGNPALRKMSFQQRGGQQRRQQQRSTCNQCLGAHGPQLSCRGVCSVFAQCCHPPISPAEADLRRPRAKRSCGSSRQIGARAWCLRYNPRNRPARGACRTSHAHVSVIECYLCFPTPPPKNLCVRQTCFARTSPAGSAQSPRLSCAAHPVRPPRARAISTSIRGWNANSHHALRPRTPPC